MPLYLVESPISTDARQTLRQRMHTVKQRATRVIEALGTTTSEEVFAIVEADSPEDATRFASRIGLHARKVRPVFLQGQSLDELMYENDAADVNYLIKVNPANAANDGSTGRGHLRSERAYRNEADDERFYLYHTPSAAQVIAAQEQIGAQIERLARIEKIA